MTRVVLFRSTDIDIYMDIWTYTVMTQLLALHSTFTQRVQKDERADLITTSIPSSQEACLSRISQGLLTRQDYTRKKNTQKKKNKISYVLYVSYVKLNQQKISWTLGSCYTISFLQPQLSFMLKHKSCSLLSGICSRSSARGSSSSSQLEPGQLNAAR